MRSSIAGSLWALVLSVAGLGIASQISKSSDAPTDALDPGRVSESAELTQSVGPADAVELVDGAGPDVTIVTVSLPTPDAVTDVAVSLRPDDRDAPRMRGEVPMRLPNAPLPDENIVIMAGPAEPEQPVREDTQAEGSEGAPSGAQISAAETTLPAVTDVPETVPAEPSPAVAPGASPTTETVTDTRGVPTPAPQAEAGPTPSLSDAPTDTAEVAPTPAAAETTAAEAPASSGVRINRPGATPSETAGQEAEIVAEVPDDVDIPAIRRFAVEFENPGGLPLMAILLIDNGGMADPAAQVAALPIPVTVVLDPLRPNATERMHAYRAAGVEVAMQISLPLGATPTDVEVAFAAAFGTLPETVALFSDENGLLQTNRSVAAQVIEVLAADGRGLVAVERGLGSVVRSARQADVAAASVLRMIDSDGASEGAIVRALDQAALRTRQTGSAVITARLVPDLLGALSAWGSEVDRDQLLVAPLTGVLLDGAE